MYVRSHIFYMLLLILPIQSNSRGPFSNKQNYLIIFRKYHKTCLIIPLLCSEIIPITYAIGAFALIGLQLLKPEEPISLPPKLNNKNFKKIYSSYCFLIKNL